MTQRVSSAPNVPRIDTRNSQVARHYINSALPPEEQNGGSELNITFRSPKEGNSVSAAPQLKKENRTSSGLKTLNDIYLDRTKHKDSIPNYSTSYIEDWKLQNLLHYKHMVQLKNELRRCITELSGNVYDLLAFKDAFIEMTATDGITLTSLTQQTTGKTPPMKMSIPYHIISDLILLSSKFYRKTSDIYWRMTELFNLIFHFEPAAMYQLRTNIPTNTQKTQVQDLECAIDDDKPIDYDYDFMGYRRMMKQYEHKCAETEVYKAQVGELDQYIQETLEPKIKFHMTQVEELQEKNEKLSIKLKYFQEYAEELYDKLSDAIMKREDVKLETKQLDNETNDVKINRLGFSVSEGMRTAHQKLSWFSELLGDVMGAPCIRMDKDVLGKLSSMQVHVMHLLKRFDGKMQDGWLYISQELDKSLNKKFDYLKGEKLQWKTFKSELAHLRKSREVVQKLANCVAEIAEYHRIHLETNEEEFGLNSVQEQVEVNPEDIRGVLLHMDKLVDEYNEIMYQTLPNVEQIRAPRQRKLGGIPSTGFRKSTVDNLLRNAKPIKEQDLYAYTQLSPHRKEQASANVSLLTEQESRLDIDTLASQETANEQDLIDEEQAIRAKQNTMSPWTTQNIEEMLSKTDDEFMDPKQEEEGYLDNIAKLNLGSEAVNSLRVVHTSVDNISRMKEIHNMRIKNVRRIYEEKVLDLETRLAEMQKQLQFCQQTSGMSASAFQDVMLMLKYGRGKPKKMNLNPSTPTTAEDRSTRRKEPLHTPKTASSAKIEEAPPANIQTVNSPADVLTIQHEENNEKIQFTPSPPPGRKLDRQTRYSGYMRGLKTKKKHEKEKVEPKFTERHIHAMIMLQDTIKITAVDVNTGKPISRDQLETMLEQELIDMDGRFPPISARRKGSHIYRDEHIVPDHLKKSTKSEKHVPTVDLVLPSDVLNSVAERVRSPRAQ